MPLNRYLIKEVLQAHFSLWVWIILNILVLLHLNSQAQTQHLKEISFVCPCDFKIEVIKWLFEVMSSANCQLTRENIKVQDRLKHSALHVVSQLIKMLLFWRNILLSVVVKTKLIISYWCNAIVGKPLQCYNVWHEVLSGVRKALMLLSKVSSGSSSEMLVWLATVGSKIDTETAQSKIVRNGAFACLTKSLQSCLIQQMLQFV